MKKWVYKVNSRQPPTEKKARAQAGDDGGTISRRAPAARGWHFDDYFGSRRRTDARMGGDQYIRSPQSWQRLRQVRKGDLFLCYQSDERKIYGLARASSDGYESEPGSGRFNCVNFRPAGLRLSNPVNLARPEHRDVFGHVGAFTVPSRGTMHALAEDEYRAIIGVLMAENPKQAAAIRAFVKT
jgi:hypothetical protein